MSNSSQPPRIVPPSSNLASTLPAPPPGSSAPPPDIFAVDGVQVATNVTLASATEAQPSDEVLDRAAASAAASGVVPEEVDDTTRGAEGLEAEGADPVKQPTC